MVRDQHWVTCDIDVTHVIFWRENERERLKQTGATPGLRFLKVLYICSGEGEFLLGYEICALSHLSV